MIKFLSMLFFLLYVVIQINAQRTIECRCNSARYSIDKYLSEADSISKVLHKKKYKKIIVIGARGLDAANLMFIGELNGRNKAFRYDLTNKRTQIFEGHKLDKWKKSFIGDSSFIQTTRLNPGIIDHEIAFYISFDYPQNSIKEICESQLLREPNRPFSRALWSYINDYSLTR